MSDEDKDGVLANDFNVLAAQKAEHDETETLTRRFEEMFPSFDKLVSQQLTSDEHLAFVARELSYDARALANLAERFVGDGARDLKYHSKTYRIKSLEELSRLMDSVHAKSKALQKAVKKVKKVKLSEEQTDQLITHGNIY